MIFNLKFTSKTHKKIQIENYIKNLIETGILQKNEKLPSTREMSLLLDVSRNTIIDVYETLTNEGYTDTIKGKGTFISDKKIISKESHHLPWIEFINTHALDAASLDTTKHELRGTDDIIPFDSISPNKNLFDIDEIKRDFLNIISIEGNNILNYGYAKGYKPLIDYLKIYMKHKGVNIDNKDILITNGFTEGFNIVLSTITEKGDTIFCENPTHNTSLKIMKLHNLNIKGIDMDDDGINIDSLKDELEKELPKAVFLIPTYHNPTSIVMSPEKRLKAIDILNSFNVPIIEDGFNEELRYSNSNITSLAALNSSNNNVIYIGSLSKILFPGMRIGWIMADKELIDYLESVKRSINIHTSFLDQAILYEYLRGENFSKYVRKAKKYYKNKYELTMKYAKKYIPYAKIWGEGGLHIFVQVEGIHSRELLANCYKKGVAFTPGDIFYTDDKGYNTFRIGFSRASEAQIKKGFEIISKAISELKAK
ncbi:GntR family transcriptional regulator/MocR family aminotransferase [Clostridium acetobutylicum]|uniref:Transcriptional regulator containing a DNA-binding HTH domain and an aminotransferase domain (MocR family) n=1 Tax=Clostridium acetobutylicum (strain ATCC 824 / DSM 792 / JCM 1419 / IAM 19013 / LMG 5710 / NBRC 13948 / NRRL B-527 / VKM B-1787 / 2291 / W) TaxID=272562 RepID=Q97D30_CLOAB|nr:MULTISPECIES: PLP-dependent aminotransferase family protein [Clostridium]AAK81573.1 Transcriptional regulator containing a DNA-binding HTH domain and an aminotransferase domain (MocR family) [Clostridium acetobutylicum ATCC 824]ADZ22695.1 Transcriptional regulator containing a DNA-binding HTH domain and an aminotransferase domain (MocR family) [Clostridium acetobutylicum EA 2018]AEI34128.1 transcriptional regulator [Clostridium acetobutylicum DSM 1731]AWV80753.1 PLP-dependent aminotransferas